MAIRTYFGRMRKRLLLLTLVIAALCPSGAQAHELTSSAARAEAAYYAQSLIDSGVGSRFRIHSCRRDSGHAVSCAFRIYGARGARCGGRVRTAYLGHGSSDTVSRVVADRC